ncbi:SGNH/GDSL hydrolase family protein [Prosthecobacter sp. SYSU 5D2]|uniref:SGNH/GDSL hydrolase family protein n=1 Tax=Prosthecobacter sp. SYSU 5D2 TaxID=3134134 RepID=UPI0031FE7C04
MSPAFRLLLPLIFGLSILPARAEQCVVLGDSLTKEYELEFPILFPTNPASWDSRNWIEILHERRNTWFDLGEINGYVDPRLTGHEHNWAFPGATAVEINDQLKSWQSLIWRTELNGQIKNAAERAVVFAGGNDVDSFYGLIYNGASPTSYINATRDAIKGIVNYVLGQKSSLPMVLVSVPHLGCAPDIQRQYPTDPLKTARVTAALDSLNTQLAAFAQSKNIAFVPGVYQLTKDIIEGPFRIGGIDFYKEADPDSRPRYVFSGDGFHPATSAHGKIAQMVIEAFRNRYPAKQITPMTDREIVASILGLDPDIPFNEWIATQALPPGQSGMNDDPDGDGLVNAAEFVLDAASASVATPDVLLPQADADATPPALTWTGRFRPQAAEWSSAKMQHSVDLLNWTDADPSVTTQNPDGSQTLRFPLQGRRFLRLRVIP